MSDRARAIVTLAALVVMGASWGAVLFAQAGRYPYEELALPAAILATTMAAALLPEIWKRKPPVGARPDSAARMLADVARRLRLGQTGRRLTGTSEGIGIVVEGTFDGRPEIVLTSCGPVDLAPQPAMRLGAQDEEVGDDEFDRKVRVSGDAIACHAVLDERTRRTWLAALERFPGLTVAGGVLRAKLGTEPRVAGEIEGAIQSLLSLAKRLAATDVLAGLLANAQGDPVAAVRLRCLRVLFARFADRPEYRRAVVAALTDSDPEVRLFAAGRTGPAGFDELEALARDSALPESIRAEAARQALRLLPAERRRALSVDLLHDPLEAVRAVAREQAERGGAEAGQLAVAEPEEGGRVSVVDEAGALSLAARGRKTTS